MDKPTKVEEFSVKLIGAVADVLQNEDNEFHISSEDLEEHATDFFHALMNMMPTQIHNVLTNQTMNILEANQLANRLVYQNKE